jgi:hypothetical protein
MFVTAAEISPSYLLVASFSTILLSHLFPPLNWCHVAPRNHNKWPLQLLLFSTGQVLIFLLSIVRYGPSLLRKEVFIFCFLLFL